MSRRSGFVVGAIGVLLLLAALVWSTVAVPALVRFPTSTDITLHYRGHLVTYVDQKTGAPLLRPASVPLSVGRTIRAIPSLSTSSTAVVHERLVVHSGSNASVENNQFTFNRRKMSEVASRQAYTFSPQIPGASVGSYYITLPMNLRSNTTGLDMWKPETATTYRLAPLGKASPPSKLDGLKVVWFQGVLPMTPVASYERAALAARGLPLDIPVRRVEAELAAEGISIPKLSRALLPVLSSSELKTVAKVLSSPVRLRYYAYGHGLVAGEPRTGAIIALRDIVDGIAAAPVTNGIDSLVTVLSHHDGVAGVRAAVTVLRRLVAASPQPVYELQYSQTPASVLDMVNTANKQRSQISLVDAWIPAGLAGLGVILVIVGAMVLWLRRAAPGGTTRILTPPTEGHRAA